MLALTEVQTALVALLKADSVLMAKITGIWYEPPANPLFPYVTMGPSIEAGRQTFGGHDNALLTFTFHIWWDTDNVDDGAAIVSDIKRVMIKNIHFFTENYDVSCAFINTTDLQDPSKDMRHMPLRYNIYAYEKVA